MFKKSIVFFIYRQPSMATTKMMVDVLRSNLPGWTIRTDMCDALISRARSTAASQWLLQCPDEEVHVQCDDDFYVMPSMLEPLAELAMEKRGIVAGVTALRSGEYTSIVPLDNSMEEPWADMD